MTEKDEIFGYGDPEFETLFVALYPRMLSYARSVLGRNRYALAEDLTGDVLYKFAKNRTPVPVCKVAAYIFAMLRNECLNHLKKTRSKNHVCFDEPAAIQRVENIAMRDFLDESSPSDETRGVNLETALNFSSSLPPRTAEVFRLSRIEKLKNAQVAHELGISVRAVEKHISLSIARYRTTFRRSG